MERSGADDLDVEVPLTQGAAGGLTDHGERLRLQVVEGLAVGDALAELDGPGRQLLVAEHLDRGLEGIDPRHQALELLQPLALADVEDLGED